MRMPPEILTALLRGEHLSMTERERLGLLPVEILDYAEVRDHLAEVIRATEWFPAPLEELSPGEPVDEHIIIQRLGRHRFVCHARRHAALDPTLLAEESHRRFWSARAAADYFLRWEHGLPGSLDGWTVSKR